MHYSELRIYKLAVKLRDELHDELNKIPYGYKIDDVGQAKRSSSSAVSNIVEGWGRRFYIKDYIKFLITSLSSSDETQNHVQYLGNHNYLTQEKTNYFQNHYKALSIQTLNFINYHRRKHNLAKQLGQQ